MITLQDYWMGRDAAFPTAMTPDIERNAERLIGLVNLLLTRYGTHPHVRSGWRPPALNRTTPNAAPNSKHMTGQAIDLDDPDGDLDEWLLTPPGLTSLAEIGLWMEHPSATKTWCHLQSIPQNSFKWTGNRVFYP